MSSLTAFLKSKILRWTLLSLGGVVVVGVAALYGITEWMLNTTYEAPAVALRLQEPPSAERGARVAATFGCVSCHGTHGKILFEAPFVGRIVTPDLARAVPAYSDAELVTIIRSGIKRDHTSAIAMPANSFSSMADSDVADIVAWLRTLKPEQETVTARTTAGPIGRVLILMGGLRMGARVPHDPAPPAARPIEPAAHGEYIVKVICLDCHLLDAPREVEPGTIAPPLREMVQAYDLEQFTHLMRTGLGAGERELKIMSEVSREGFAKMTDEEIAAVHTYLSGSQSNTAAAN